MVCFISSHSTSSNIFGIDLRLLFLQLDGENQIVESTKFALGVPKCGEGLSEMIASVFFFFSIRNGTNKRQTHRIKRTN